MQREDRRAAARRRRGRRASSRLGLDLVASGCTAQDPTLWGPDAKSEVDDPARLDRGGLGLRGPWCRTSLALRDELRAAGVNHFVLGGMGGSSLAPEVITRTYGVELTVLDSTDPDQVRSRPWGTACRPTRRRDLFEVGFDARDRQPKRVYEQAFRDAGIDHLERHHPSSPTRARRWMSGASRRLPGVQRRPERRRSLLGA